MFSIKPDGTEVIAMLQCSIVAGKLAIDREAQLDDVNGLESLEKLSKVGLVIIGQDILFKKIPDSSSRSALEIVKQAFPFLKLSDFVFQLYRSERDSFVSIAKKEQVHGILRKLRGFGIIPISICLGPSVVSQLLPLLSASTGKAHISGYEVIYDDHGIREINIGQGVADELVLANDAPATSFPLNLAAILSALYPLEMEFSDTSLLVALRNEFRYKVIFHTLLPVSLVVLLLVLTLNAFYFQHYTAQNELLMERHSAAIAVRAKLEAVSRVYLEKKRFVDSLDLTAGKRIAFYADRLAKSLPSTIQWESVDFYPQLKNRNHGKLTFMKDQILVRGACGDPLLLQRWIGQLEDFSWIEEIKGQKYSYNEETRIGEFEFMIYLKKNSENGL